jgi:hypothetical protein
MPAGGTGTGSFETRSETCATAFTPKGLLHNRGTPGISDAGRAPRQSGRGRFGGVFDPGKDRPTTALRLQRPGKANAGVSKAPLAPYPDFT